MALDRQSIFSADDRKLEKVPVPEWGGHVFVRVLEGHERDHFELSMGPSRANIRARLAVMCMCDESGERIFSDDDALELGRKSGNALDRIFAEATKLNRITKAEVEQLEEKS